MDSKTAVLWARTTGLLILLSGACGGFGEVYVPGILHHGDPAATFNALLGDTEIYRLSFAAYLVEAVCDVTLILAFYLLFEAVSSTITIAATLFGIMSTSSFMVGEFVYFVPSLLLPGHSGFPAATPEQRQLITQTALVLYGYGSSVFLLFYGITTMLRGALMLRAPFLPNFLGIFMVIAGATFIIQNAIYIFVPSAVSALLFLPMFVATFSTAFWFLAFGLDTAAWRARQVF